jgi:hypothetical protein
MMAKTGHDKMTPTNIVHPISSWFSLTFEVLSYGSSGGELSVEKRIPLCNRFAFGALSPSSHRSSRFLFALEDTKTSVKLSFRSLNHSKKKILLLVTI